MGKIFCVMGKSSSGKDTVFRRLVEDKELNLKSLVIYTTRPRRSNEENGREYFFINDQIILEYEQENKIIEKRVYNTINGLWTYATIADGQVDLTNNSYIYIATLESYKSMKRYYGEDNVIPIYLEIDDGVRLERALRREQGLDKPNYKELCRRYIADSDDFSEENIKSARINTIYDNTNLAHCLNKIKNMVIKSIL